jgi:hypothetical protein
MMMTGLAVMALAVSAVGPGPRLTPRGGRAAARIVARRDGQAGTLISINRVPGPGARHKTV